jgi:hypothetical protein
MPEIGGGGPLRPGGAAPLPELLRCGLVLRRPAGSDGSGRTAASAGGSDGSGRAAPRPAAAERLGIRRLWH